MKSCYKKFDKLGGGVYITTKIGRTGLLTSFMKPLTIDKLSGLFD